MRGPWMLATLLVVVGCSTSPLPGTPCEGGETLSRSCGGACGVQQAACIGGQWSAWGDCTDVCTDGGALPDLGSNDGGTEPCVDGDVETRGCGKCGTMQRTCATGAWGPFGDCSGEGECTPGAIDAMSCGSSVGVCRPGAETRTCSTTCSWSGWTSCGGSGYVPPSPEVCGDGLDNNCNGVADEGCSCSPVDIGQGSSFLLAGTIVKMVSDPHACLVYALDAATPSRLVVLDTKNKALLTAISLPYAASDFDISPNGQFLVVSHPSVQKISIIDKGLWTVANTLAVPAVPQEIEVSDGGIVYYATYDQWSETHRLDLSVGASSDSKIGSWNNYMPDIELSADGSYLYAGESGTSGGKLYKWGLATGMEVNADVSTWNKGYGFYNPARWALLSPGGQHIYYAGFQLDANNLARVNGATGERVFAEDAAGTFAIGENDVLDAQLVTHVATLPVKAAAAALTAADREVWYWSGGRAYYQNVDDFLAGVALGVRARPAQPLTSYSISRLIADPVRPRVYGLDSAHQLVVAIDTTTAMATGAIVVGSLPSDIDVSASGGTLWIGHEGMLALGKIDLASWQFGGFVPVPIDSYDVAAIGDRWVAAIDYDQWTTPTLVDATSGLVADSKSTIYEGALATAGDGKTLFVGESGISGGNVYRFDVSTGKLVQTARSSYDNGYGFPYPPRAIQCAADGSFVYYAGYSIEGTGLATLNYAQADPIVTVTRDDRLAISATKVYRASDGALLGTLPVTGTSQAASSDSKSLYVLSGGVLQTVDLTAY